MSRGSVVGRRRGQGWVRVGYGLHRPRSADDATAPVDPEDGDPAAPAAARRRRRLALDAEAWLSVLPDEACFSHLTAAILRDWWLPPLPDDLPLFVAQGPTGRHAERPQLRVTRHPEPPLPDHLGSLRLTGVADTLIACARDLGLLDLVCLVDCVLQRGEATLAELTESAAVRRRGAPRLRQALALADDRSESLWETVLRLLHVSCQVPVTPQHEVRNADGWLVARGDLWINGTRDFHEYDGGEHLRRPRQRRDLRRSRRLGHEDWHRRGYTREDVLFQGVAILRDADASLGRGHDPARERQNRGKTTLSGASGVSSPRSCRRRGWSAAAEVATRGITLDVRPLNR